MNNSYHGQSASETTHYLKEYDTNPNKSMSGGLDRFQADAYAGGYVDGREDRVQEEKAVAAFVGGTFIGALVWKAACITGRKLKIMWDARHNASQFKAAEEPTVEPVEIVEVVEAVECEPETISEELLIAS